MTLQRVHRSPVLRRNRSRRSGFTLVELLVSISIFIVLAAISLSAFKTSTRDKVNAGVRQIQAVINGAKSRASKAGEPRGVRLVLDPNNRRVVSALQYIGPAGYHTGTVRVQIAPSDREFDGATIQPVCRIVCEQENDWATLNTDGMIGTTARIRIPADHTGRWYNITNINFTTGVGFINQVPVGATWDADPSWDGSVSAARPTYQMQPRNVRNTGVARTTVPAPTPNSDPYEYSNSAPITYLMRLDPQPLPNTSPVNFPPGVVIDLDASQIPSAWRRPEDADHDATLDGGEDLDGSGQLDLSGQYAPDFPAAYMSGPFEMDLMFAPNGTAHGDTATYGPLYFVMSHLEDVELAHAHPVMRRIDATTTNLPYLVPGDYQESYGPAADFPTKERKMIAIYPLTGNSVISQVNGTSTNAYRLADNPFAYAVSGKESK